MHETLSRDVLVDSLKEEAFEGVIGLCEPIWSRFWKKDRSYYEYLPDITEMTRIMCTYDDICPAVQRWFKICKPTKILSFLRKKRRAIRSLTKMKGRIEYIQRTPGKALRSILQCPAAVSSPQCKIFDGFRDDYQCSPTSLQQKKEDPPSLRLT